MKEKINNLIESLLSVVEWLSFGLIIIGLVVLYLGTLSCVGVSSYYLNEYHLTNDNKTSIYYIQDTLGEGHKQVDLKRDNVSKKMITTALNTFNEAKSHANDKKFANPNDWFVEYLNNENQTNKANPEYTWIYYGITPLNVNHTSNASSVENILTELKDHYNFSLNETNFNTSIIVSLIVVGIIMSLLIWLGMTWILVFQL